MSKIPKIIHYCWVGGNPKPQSVLYCIESWKRCCPDYQIMEWNESNYDFTKNQYMHEAYEAKKWGFVPDYARLDIVYQYGGIYLDTDVEMVRSFDDLLDNESFFGFEDTGENSYFVACGLGFGAKKHNELIKTLRDYYDPLSFRNADGSLNLTPAPRHNTPVFADYGIEMNNQFQVLNGNAIYPAEYFCPKIFKTGKLTLTPNTFSIHHFSASWMDEAIREDLAHMQKICSVLGDRLGHLYLYAESALKKYPLWKLPKIAMIHIYEALYSSWPLFSARLTGPFRKEAQQPNVVLFDTAAGTKNVGDQIIMENCTRQLGGVLDLSEAVHVSTHVLPDDPRLCRGAHKLVCGTNILSCRMKTYGLWKLPRDLRDYRNITLMGVGFDSYNTQGDRYTRKLLRYMLSSQGFHSVRDTFSEKCLKSLGISNVLYTGCPTMWGLTPEKCASIPAKKASRVVCTVTDYLRDYEKDHAMLKALLESYDEVYLWLQGSEDAEYVDLLGFGDSIHIVENTLDAYDRLLEEEDLDYIGTRLHAGIRALNAGHRSLIVSIDNRAACISEDTGLPTIRREDVIVFLKKRIFEAFKTEITMPWENITQWKNQFLSK